jgi:putative transposase
MLRFRQMKMLQKFASVHANINNHFSLERHLTDQQTYKERRSAALAEWQSGRVADPCELGRCAQRSRCIVWSALRVRLTAPNEQITRSIVSLISMASREPDLTSLPIGKGY